MREFAKSHAGKLISREFLGRTHPYKWRCSERHTFYAIFWELKEKLSLQSFDSILTDKNMQIDTLFSSPTSIDDIPEVRLEVLGGIEGLFKAMKYHNVEPDEKLFNNLIQVQHFGKNT
jgi:hypothetical protein